VRLGNLESGALDCLFQMLSREEDRLVMSHYPSMRNAKTFQAWELFECITQSLFAAGRFEAGHGELGVNIFMQPGFIGRISLFFIHGSESAKHSCEEDFAINSLLRDALDGRADL
jgi:hypothetical protein